MKPKGSQRKNPWGTAQWKQMRQETLGDACEQCGATDRTLVLQHMWHPPSYAQVIYETSISMGMQENNPRVKSQAYQIYQANHERYISGRDAVTYCDKCAYMWDKHNLKLCPKCKNEYHSMEYELCKRCAKKKRDQEIYGKDLFERLE